MKEPKQSIARSHNIEKISFQLGNLAWKSSEPLHI